MGQIAKDFNFVESASESAGRAISRNLATGVDQAKAQVKTLASQYAQAQAASDAAASSLQKLSQAHSIAAGATEQAGKATATSAAELELEAAAQDVAAAAKTRAVELYGKYSSAVEDARRKQDLLSASLADSNKSVQAASTGAQRIGNAFQTHLAQAGTKSATMFHQRFAAQMVHSGQSVMQTGKNFASSMLMGMTPMTLGAAGMGLAVGAAFKSGFDRNADINTAKIRLEALGYDAATVNQITADATQAVTDTQYSLADSLTASTKAMAMNIKPGKEMVDYLTMIANASALSGRGFGEMEQVFGRVHRYGTVRLENLESLISAEVPVMEVLKEYYKTDESGIRAMVENREISSATVEQLLSKRLEGMAKDVGSKSVPGAFKNMWLQVGKITASIVEPLFGDDIPSAINKASAALGGFADYIRPGVAAFATKMKDWWADVQPYLAKGWKWLKDTWNDLWPKIQAAFDVFAEHWNAMWPKLKEKMGPFFQSLKRAWDTSLPLLKVVGAVVGWLFLKFIDFLPTLVQWATNVINWFSNVKEWLTDKFWPWLTDAWETFTDEVVGAWHTAVEWKDKVVNAFEEVKSGTEKVWNWLEEKFEMFKGWIDFLKRNAHWITDPLSSLKNLFTGSDGQSYAIDPVAYSTAMPAGLIDSGNVPSGPQSRTAAAAVLSKFPEIATVNGSYLPRSQGGPSVPGTHDAGLSIDIPIAANQKSVGDEIEAYLQANASKFGIKYTIWRNKGKYPGGGGFDQGGHQDHIDVHFDGNPVIPSSAGAYTNATASRPLGGKDAQLAAALRANGFNDSQITGLIALNNVETGNWSHPESIMGFTNQQVGPGISSHVSGFKEMWDRRQRTGAVSPVGSSGSGQDAAGDVVDPAKFANWLLKLEGYSATQDWAGNQYAPGQFLPAGDYANSVTAAYGRRTVSASEFGGVNNLSVEKPLNADDLDSILNQLSTVNPLPPHVDDPIKFAPWMGRGGGAHGTGSLGPMFGDQSGGAIYPWNPATRPRVNDDIPWWRGVLDKIGTPPQMWNIGPYPRNTGALEGTNKGPLAPWARSPFASAIPFAPGVGPNPSHGDYGTPTTIELDMPNVPKGTKDDPQHVQDDTVAENTDPGNQPEPVGPDAGSAGTPHGATTVGPDGVPRDANGNRIPKLAQGAGDIGQTAFGDMFEGTPFSNPMEWGATKSAGAALTFFGNLLSGNAGGGAGGLAGMLFPDAGGSSKDGRQARDAKQVLEDKQHAVDKETEQYNKLLRNRDATDEEKKDAKYQLDRSARELADAQADYNADYGTPAAGGGGGLGGLLSFLPSPSALLNPVQPAPGSSSGTGPLPGPQPPSNIPNAANTVPPIGSGGAGGPTTIDRSITVNGATPEGMAASRDQAARAENASARPDLLAINNVPRG